MKKKDTLELITSINHLIKDLKDDKIDGIYLPNTRWFYGERQRMKSRVRFANQLACLADIFVK
jgi:phosphoglycerate kinase